MAAIRPPNGPSTQDKIVNPIFPPRLPSTANGLNRPVFPPGSSISPVSFNRAALPANPLPVPPTQASQATLNNQYNAVLSPPMPSSNTYNAKLDTSPLPPPSSSLATNNYNPIMNNQPSSTVLSSSAPPLPLVPPLPTTGVTHNLPSQLNVRPMYPSPVSTYHPVVQQQPYPVSQPTMTMPMAQQSHPPLSSPPLPPPPSLSSTYPYPQQSTNANSNGAPSVPPSIYSGQVGQPPSIPAPMPYAMGGNTAGLNTQPFLNTNGSTFNNNNNTKAQLIDLLKARNVISPFSEDPPISPLLNEETQQMNCSPEVMRCSLNAIPQTKDLLTKSRLPLGVVIHPFKDLESLSVIQGTKIVRCDGCKSYINPFVTFFDNSRWRCSVCFRSNDLPQEFLYDPISKTYGDPTRRPEVRFGTVEYIASSDYMARPPQPAIYLFLLDISHNAMQTGYLQSFCDILYECLNSLPGDARTKIGFLGYDSRIHFFDLSDSQNGRFHIMVAPDLENIENKLEEFFPIPDGLLVTLCDSRTIVETFLNELPKIYQNNDETDSALGAALVVAGSLLHQTGGRVSVFQTRIPNKGPGDLNAHTGKEPTSIRPTSDFYKKLSLDYASQQIACDLFSFNSHYIDLTTICCIARYSGGEIKYYPGYHSVQKPQEVDRFENDLRRYLQRKIGFEAVMRLRVPPALSIYTFHGNGFVRSVDLLVLPNINPDAAYGMQISIDDTLAQYRSVTFQIALLYTTSKGERRIRVHTLSLPVSSNLNDIFANVDQEAVISLVGKMAVDRSITSSVQEAREALTNVAVDVLKAATQQSTMSNREYSLVVPWSIRSIPLYVLSMIKSMAFRPSSTTNIDDRSFYMDLCKTLPTQYLIKIFYPDLYPIHTIEDKSRVIGEGDDALYIPERVHLSFQNIDAHGAYVLDAHETIYIFIGRAISDHFLQSVFNVKTFSALPFDSYTLPDLSNPLSEKIHDFVTSLIHERTNGVALHIMREDSINRHLFTRYFVDDKSESTMAYVEFLRYLRDQIVK